MLNWIVIVVFIFLFDSLCILRCNFFGILCIFEFEEKIKNGLFCSCFEIKLRIKLNEFLFVKVMLLIIIIVNFDLKIFFKKDEIIL